MIIKERKHIDGGMGGGYYVVRVRALDKGEEKPEGAVEMPDDAALSDWVRDENQDA